MKYSENKTLQLKITLSGAAFGLLFPVITYFILEYTSKTVYHSVKEHPLFIIMCLVPLLSGLLCYFFSTAIKKQFHFLEYSRDKQSEIIDNTIQYVNNIGAGNYETEINFLEENKVLAESLLGMSNSLKVSKIADTERNWIVNGESEVGDILRSHSSIKELAENLTVFLTKKLDVTQCAFYTINDEDENDVFIELIASYAYNRKKYLNNKFKIGQGLVGQSIIEQDTIYRTEIPKNYVSITSGLLGDKKPYSLLIVPLITNEKVYGALEFASLAEIPKLHIQFLNEVGDIIARTIFNLTVNAKTIKLLFESQQMGTELDTQRRELLKNAEQMQIAQEELTRSNANLEYQINEVSKAADRQNALLERASEIITIYESDGEIRYESPSIKEILGYTPEELMGKRDSNRMHPEDKKLFRESFDYVLKEYKSSKVFQYRYIHKSGREIWIESTLTNLIDDSSIKGVVMNSRDITIRMLAEKEQRMRGKMQALSENSLDLITRIDASGKLYYVNPMIRIFSHVTPGELIEQNYRSLNLPADLVSLWDEMASLVGNSNAKSSLEISLKTLEGSGIYMVHAIPEFNEKADLETILIVTHDITEQKLKETEIKEKNKSITESINYSYRIQSSLLPTESMLKDTFKNAFMFYKPKDVVSGDFPFLYKKGDDIYVAAVDCTGHGVPGALMSFIGHFTLNQILSEQTVYDSGQVLDELHTRVQKTLKQDTVDSFSKDGMDIALCRINLKTLTVEFSGAHRPLYFVRNNELQEVKADRYPIAGMNYKNRKPFTKTVLTVQKNDVIYFNTDGLPDQFGGPGGNQKFMSAKVRELVLETAGLEMTEACQVFSSTFYDWKGSNKQMDDVLLMAIKF